MSDEIFRLFPDSAHAATITQAFAPGPLLSGDTAPLARRPILMVFTNRCGSTFIAAKLSEAGYVGPPTAHRNFEFFNADILIAASPAWTPTSAPSPPSTRRRPGRSFPRSAWTS
jgi:hypothetical protein